MKILESIVGAIARIIHPDKPREWFENVRFPTDLPAKEVAARLDEAAKANPQFKNWRTSIVDLMKLTHPDDPDGASSPARRAELAAELAPVVSPNNVGRPDYTGTAEENRWLHDEVFKAIQQRGIPLPTA